MAWLVVRQHRSVPRCPRRLLYERMFDDWVTVPGVEILWQLDRPVLVDTRKVWPTAHMPFRPPTPRVQQHGANIKPRVEGRQVAWLRRNSGEYLALVVIAVRSADGASRMLMPLWVQCDAFRPLTDIEILMR